MTNLEWLFRTDRHLRNYVSEEVWCRDRRYGAEFDRWAEVAEWLLAEHDGHDEETEDNMRGCW